MQFEGSVPRLKSANVMFSDGRINKPEVAIRLSMLLGIIDVSFAANLYRCKTVVGSEDVV